MSSVIKGFKAAYYNVEKFNNLDKFVCPPYDVISGAQLKALRKKSKYNFVNVILSDDKTYRRSAALVNEMIKTGVLVQDTKDAIYLYEQIFNFKGKEYKRYGILSLLRMDKEGFVSPHEFTLSAPKADRKRIISAVKANLSPIFVLVPKPLKFLTDLYKKYSKTEPFIKVKDSHDVKNSVWKIDAPAEVKKITTELSKHKMVIADGHHRFEVASWYNSVNKGKYKNLNYLMTYYTDVQPGLLMLPTHRIAKVQTKDFFGKLSEYFEIKRVRKDYVADKVKGIAGISRNKKSDIFEFGIYYNRVYYWLILKNRRILNKNISEKMYQSLDTYVLHKFVFKIIDAGDKFNYTHNLNDIGKLTGTGEVAFLVKPTPAEVVFGIASKGVKLPQKSTYFHPKVTSGIVIRRFEK
ncbi:MAG: DUF1015 domain-containing protein [Candidatus Omnitrophota bacterium]|nr:DUF1015 domain-containing protein [Candidatus Omnitrophota bacterium]